METNDNEFVGIWKSIFKVASTIGVPSLYLASVQNLSPDMLKKILIASIIILFFSFLLFFKKVHIKYVYKVYIISFLLLNLCCISGYYIHRIYFSDPITKIRDMARVIDDSSIRKSIGDGDIELLELYMMAGESLTGWSYPGTGPIWIVSINDNIKNRKNIIMIMHKYGFDFNGEYKIESINNIGKKVDEIINIYGPYALCYCKGENKRDTTFLNGYFVPWKLAIAFEQTETLKDIISIAVNRDDVVNYVKYLINDLKTNKKILNWKKELNIPYSALNNILKKDWIDHKRKYLEELLKQI